MDDEYASLWFDEIKANNANKMVHAQLDKIIEAISATGVVFFGDFRKMDVETLTNVLEKANPPIDKQWIVTLARFMGEGFTFPTAPVEDTSSTT